MNQTPILATLALLFALFAGNTLAKEPAAPSLININTAPAELLVELDGIGETKAIAIVSHRETNGPFESAEDLTSVRGIGPGTLENNAGRITVD